MPRSAVAVACALLVGTAVVMAFEGVGLAADGAYELIHVLGSGNVFGTDARLFAAYVDHGLVVVAARAGATDTHLLRPSRSWPARHARARLVGRDRSRRRRPARLRSVTMTAALCCGAMWFAGVSPIVLAVPLTVAVAAVLWLPRDW